MKIFKMTDLTKHAISETVSNRANQIKVWDHRDKKSQITDIFQNSKFYKKNQNGRLAINTIVIEPAFVFALANTFHGYSL